MKKLKKATAIICCLILLIASAISVSATKKSWSPVINIDTVTAARGDTVYVNVVLAESQEGIMATTFSLLYDNTALSYQGFKKGIFYDKPSVVDHGDYITVVICENITNFALGNIITVEFKVKDDAYAGFYPVKIANIRPNEKGESLKGCFANWRGDTITPIVTNGGVNVPLTQENCKHSFGEWETKTEPTCDDTGLKTRVCSECGKNENEELSVTSHIYDDFWTIDRAATADEEGVMSRHCKNCDAKTDYVTFKQQSSEDNGFKNEADTTLDEKDWQELEDFKTDGEEEKPTEQPGNSTAPQEPQVNDKPSDTEITEIPESAEDLIDRTKAEEEERLGIAGRIYMWLYGEDGRSGIISVIVTAFKEFINNL